MKFSLQIGADVVVFNADGRVEDAHIDRWEAEEHSRESWERISNLCLDIISP